MSDNDGINSANLEKLAYGGEVLNYREPSSFAAPAGSVACVITDEVENLLVNIAQILDVVKTEWGESWSSFDQEQRDHITKLLMAKRPPNS